MSNVRRFSLIAALALAVAAALAPGASAAWTGASFTQPSTTSQFTGSSCVSSTFCIFSGYQTGGATRGLLYRLENTTYGATTPASSTAEFYGVSCTATTLCIAVGTDFVAGTPGRAEKFNGSTWANTSFAAAPSAVVTQPRSVSCPGTTTCVAAGRFQTATSDTGLVETWNGTHWTATTLTRPSGTTALELNDVHCTTTTACTAVGWFESAQPRTPIAYRFNGSTWTTQTTATLSGSTGAELSGVACPTATSCQAVGYQFDSLGVQTTLAETWNGTTWSTRSVATPTTGQDAQLNDISCFSATGCIAVGNYTQADNFNVEKNVALWNGSAWSLQTDSRPMSVTDAQLNGVSCPTSTTCRAAGVSVYDGTTTTTGPRPTIDVGT
ncbi:hypothetical protein [Baekduia sp. Peel2402]|uniref:hypothetical protein n=1 Tax=Baekduia sp. Peel2402 TaxID=3458296 RepID=UPI00403EAEEC